MCPLTGPGAAAFSPRGHLLRNPTATARMPSAPWGGREEHCGTRAARSPAGTASNTVTLFVEMPATVISGENNTYRCAALMTRRMVLGCTGEARMAGSNRPARLPAFTQARWQGTPLAISKLPRGSRKHVDRPREDSSSLLHHVFQSSPVSDMASPVVTPKAHLVPGPGCAVFRILDSGRYLIKGLLHSGLFLKCVRSRM